MLSNRPVREYCIRIHFDVVSLLFLFRSCAALNAYVIYTWKITHLVKLWHLDLFCNFGLLLTSRWMGLKLIADFPSNPKPYRLGVPFLIFRPNHKLVWFKDLMCQRQHTLGLLPQTLIHQHLCSSRIYQIGS